MGLDAVVYKRLEDVSLPRGTDLDLVRIEATTGEVYLEGDKPVDAEAIHKRLGNMALVASLRDQIGTILGGDADDSVLIGNILYSGTHGGDVVPVEALQQLKSEIALLRHESGSHMSPELESFLVDMEELVAASEQHGNPVVFV